MLAEEVVPRSTIDAADTDCIDCRQFFAVCVVDLSTPAAVAAVAADRSTVVVVAAGVKRINPERCRWIDQTELYELIRIVDRSTIRIISLLLLLC